MFKMFSIFLLIHFETRKILDIGKIPKLKTIIESYTKKTYYKFKNVSKITK